VSIKVTTYHVPVTFSVEHESRKKWFIDRDEGITYKTDTPFTQILFEVIRVTHSAELELQPVKSLEGTRIPITQGDIVRIEIPHKPHGVPADYYMRTESDWLKFDGNVIQLLKHFQ